MELERLLKDEGITPAMMKENRELLVNAMKSTLKNEVWAESVPESYATAPEYNSDNYALSALIRDTYRTAALFSKSLLGSAPPCGAEFTDAFLQRQSDAATER